MTIANADTAQAFPPARSQLAENVVKERIKSFGFRTWSEGGAEAGQRADALVIGEAQVKRLSMRLEASGLTVTKYALTSWTVKCIDRQTGEVVQRIGRAGHTIDAASRGIVFPNRDGREVEDRHFKLVGVGKHGPGVKRKPRFDMHRRTKRPPHQFAHAAQEVGNIDDILFQFLATRKRQHAFGEQRAALGGLSRVIEQADDGAAAIETAHGSIAAEDKGRELAAVGVSEHAGVSVVMRKKERRVLFRLRAAEEMPVQLREDFCWLKKWIATITVRICGHHLLRANRA